MNFKYGKIGRQRSKIWKEGEIIASRVVCCAGRYFCGLLHTKLLCKILKNLGIVQKQSITIAWLDRHGGIF
jgi:hypothetical protein